MKRKLVVGLIFLLGIGVAMGWAQVYPVRWDDPEPLIPAVGPGEVAIGDGGLGLNPDTSFHTATAGPNANVLLILGTNESVPVEERCSAANRGEIRLKELEIEVVTGTVWHVDSLCHCVRKQRQVFDVPDITTYHWACYNSGLNG